MHRRPRSPALAALALAALAFVLPARADAACTLSACDASALTANAACCTASSCTIDGTLTVSGPTCSFDFGTRNLTISGQVAAQGKTITLKAKSVKLTGLIDVRGPNGADAGNVTVVTTGMTAVAFSQEGGTSAIIDASSTAGAGGMIAIVADGAVMLTKGAINATGGPAAVGGFVNLSTSSGDVNVQIAVNATGGVAPTFGLTAGLVSITAPGNLVVGGSGRLVADTGSISATMGGAASFAAGAVIQANLGGDITMRAASLSSLAEFRANGDFGSVDLETTAGPLYLSLLSAGITVGVGGSVSLTTDSAVPDGTLTIDMPITAPSSSVDVSSAGAIIVSKKIATTGLLDNGGGDITLEAAGAIHTTKAIVGADLYSVEDLDITAGGDVLIEGNIDLRGGLDADGGALTITAGGSLTVQGDTFINVAGADSSSGGSMDLEASRDLTIASTVSLVADASPIGTAGSIELDAGMDTVGAPRFPGNLTLAGDIKANGHSTLGNQVTLSGCNVSIPGGAIIDITGDTGSTTTVTARTSLAIGGQLKATGANVLEYRAGVLPMITGTLTPAPSAGACLAGNGTPDGCERAVCAGDGVPLGCLYPCPSCGDGVTTFPETCDTGAGGPFCSGSDFCDQYCRVTHCVSPNPCIDEACDATQGCVLTVKPNGLSCSDGTVCNGDEHCENGFCATIPGSVPACGSDGNPCTADGCDPQGGCFHTPLSGTGIQGCDDNNPCTGVETCVAGTCQAGTLVQCPAGKVCDSLTGQCNDSTSCQDASQCPDDNNPCTTTTCNGSCGNTPVPNGTSCDDGDLCNGIRSCSDGVCQPPTSPVVCNDGDVCTTDACDPLTGQCGFTPIAGCCNTAGDCNDQDVCTTDACVDHVCSHTAVTCNDGDPCTDDSCSAAAGCQFVAVPGCQACATAATCSDDADPCTDKACVAGRCAQVANPNCCNTPADCIDIDRNPCTDNGTTCINNRCAAPIPLTGTACGTPCTPKTCQNGTCVPDAPMDCSDNNPCTTDICTDDQGCVHTPISQCCLATNQCDDQSVCTTDTCDLDANRCTHVTPDPTCTPCLGNDPTECGPSCANACQGGRCVETTNRCCFADGDCDDGQACNGAEHCVAGTCESQPSPECDDGDSCTIDSCADASGCVHTPKSSYDSIRCRLDDMGTVIAAASADAVNAKLRKQLVARIGKVQAKVEKASAATTKCSKARGLLTASAKQLRALQRTINRAVGHKIDATLGATLAAQAGDGASKADTVRDGLSC